MSTKLREKKWLYLFLYIFLSHENQSYYLISRFSVLKRIRSQLHPHSVSIHFDRKQTDWRCNQLVKLLGNSQPWSISVSSSTKMLNRGLSRWLEKTSLTQYLFSTLALPLLFNWTCEYILVVSASTGILHFPLYPHYCGHPEIDANDILLKWRKHSNWEPALKLSKR